MSFSPDKIQITFDPANINPAEVFDYLKTSYWAGTRTLQEVITTINTAAVVAGIIYEGKLIGFARIVSDCVNFGLLCDVFIKDEYQGNGLGKLLVREILRHPTSSKLKRIILNTRDAHRLYEKFGFFYDAKKTGADGTPNYSMSYIKVSDDYYIKYFTRDDMDDAVALVENYWDPSLRRLVHPMFYRDFHKTCFSARTFDGKLIGFVLSFISQDTPDEGYIHTIFVHPDWRKAGVAKNLYNKLFFELSTKGVKKIRLITSIENELSRNFHLSMGFQYAIECDTTIDGVPAVSDYYGKNRPRVVMEKSIGA